MDFSEWYIMPQRSSLPSLTHKTKEIVLTKIMQRGIANHGLLILLSWYHIVGPLTCKPKNAILTVQTQSMAAHQRHIIGRNWLTIQNSKINKHPPVRKVFLRITYVVAVIMCLQGIDWKTRRRCCLMLFLFLEIDSITKKCYRFIRANIIILLLLYSVILYFQEF